MADYALCYRLNGNDYTLPGWPKSANRTRGLTFVCRYGTTSKIPVFKLVRKGSRHAQPGLTIHFNGIDFKLAPISNNDRAALDDCGQIHYRTDSVTASFDDGWYFGDFWGSKGGIMSEITDSPFTISTLSPWTVAFKVKGSSASTDDCRVIAVINAKTSAWNMKNDPDTGEIFFFLLNSNGDILFRNYFNDVTFSGSLTDWRDFKITFYPTDTTVYNSELEQTVRQVNFTAVCDGVTKTGTTYYVDTASARSFNFKIGYNYNYNPNKNGSGACRGLEGWLKYFSVSQDEQGYSDYRRDSHKVALYFD